MRPSAPAELAETHSAVVVKLGDRAYKVKKPVELGFLDFRTRESRETACHREVRLNRRMAPDVYLGVADITGPGGQLCDHMVVMRRLPDAARLSQLVAGGHDVRDALWSVAHQLATLHATSPPGEAHADVGRTDALRTHWLDNLAVVRARAPAPPSELHLDRIEHLVDRYLQGREALLDARARGGCVVDGHGDLRAEDIFVLPDGPRVLDCLDFSEELRWGDRLLDAAFLAMDLDDLGHPELAGAFLTWQRELSGDTWPTSLAHHYIAYRAGVRAKVAAIQAEQRDEPVGADVTRYCDLTAEHLEAGRVRLILVGGLPGTGKTSVARRVADRAGAVALSSDEIRREVSGPVESSTPDVGEGRYAPAARRAVYDELCGRAAALLRGGESVVLDATWADASARQRARELSDVTASDLDEIRCVAAPALVEARIAARRARGTDASEATVDVARWMASRFDPWPEAHVLETTAPIGAVADAALAVLGLDRRPRMV